MILGLLTVGSLIWYLVTARTSGDLKLMGTVDANEVMVSSKIPGRIQELAIQEGQQVQAGELIATIESNDLAAAANAAKATVLSSESKLKQAMVTENQNLGETSSATINAQAQVKAATAALAQTQANLTHQQADSTRTIALAQRGIASKQASEEAVASLQASHAAVTNAQANLAAAEASLKQAQAHELLANATAHTVSANRADVENAQAMATEAGVELGYAKVFAPVSGHVNVLAAREGEVVTAGEAIATVMDLTQTWVYAPLPETQADAVQLGDSLRVVMPSGRAVDGKVIAKTALADFATQRDINGGRKRDIRTIQLKLLIPNPKEEFVPGMTAEVYVPKAKLVKQ